MIHHNPFTQSITNHDRTTNRPNIKSVLLQESLRLRYLLHVVSEADWLPSSLRYSICPNQNSIGARRHTQVMQCRVNSPAYRIINIKERGSGKSHHDFRAFLPAFIRFSIARIYRVVNRHPYGRPPPPYPRTNPKMVRTRSHNQPIDKLLSKSTASSDQIDRRIDNLDPAILLQDNHPLHIPHAYHVGAYTKKGSSRITRYVT